MKIHPLIPSILLAVSIQSCDFSSPITFEPSSLSQYEPEYHFIPPSGWMNDPNGMVYQNGTYHLFYQYYPDSTVWGPMHWGHATSADLLSWKDEGIALYPDSLGYIFSGSAMLDESNSSGFGTESNPPLVAIFTYHDMEKEKAGELEYQSQGIAYSLDNGKTWTKYQGNPVLPNQGIKDFRDPKVSRIQDSAGNWKWLMTLAVLDRIQFFESSDLKSWTLLSEFGQSLGAHGGVWECPDLIPMKTPSGQEKYVLLVSINPGGPQQGSATQYFIGDFKNGEFIPDDELIRWLDYGPDNYAGVTWSNIPSERKDPLFIGWMSNWLYAQVVPTEKWRSSMTIPRELNLFQVGDKLLVQSQPAKELESLRKKTYSISSSESALPSVATEITAEIENPESFSLTLSNELGEKVVINQEMGLINIDRSNSGKVNFHPDFAKTFSAPMSWEAKSIRIFIDAHSIELFINNGEIAMTTLVLPNSPWKNVEGIQGLENVKIYDLKK